MTTFQFDTSGAVQSPIALLAEQGLRWSWSDLSPFVQGYVEAMFRSRRLERDQDLPITLGFSDLAPETLARIMEDCASKCARPFGAKDVSDLRAMPDAGVRFWVNRQGRRFDAFPPLTVYLGDDGKVYLRETSHA